MFTPPPKPNTAEFQRLRYWQGQMLRSRDFRDQVAVANQLQWWHNRALHNAYGVAIGFEVTDKEGSTPENPGDRFPLNLESSLLVYPGIAYDCFGRPLILQRQREISLPQDLLEENLALIVRYKETEEFPNQDDLSGVCVATEAAYAIEEPQFFWKSSQQVSIKDGVSLGTLSASEAEDTELVFFQLRSFSRPLARPYIARGTTIPGNTAWAIWNTPTGEENNNLPAIGFQVEIDTSSAGFTEVPCYFAWLQGSFWNLLNGEASSVPSIFFAAILKDICKISLSNFIFAPLTHIDRVAMNRFIFRIWMPQIPVAAVDKDANQEFECNFLALAQQQELYVSWLGIQSGSNSKHQGEV